MGSAGGWSTGGPRVPCVGALVHDDEGRLLVVRRRHEPGAGLWSVPGGRVEPGETARDAVVRELAEETGLAVVPEDLAGTVERDGPGGVVYVIEDWFAGVAPGTDPADVRAGDDADEARWVPLTDVPDLPCVDGLLDALRDWNVVP
jgi:ADP-ribose pyrophosphatase YjhB (NUDIX family)